MSWTDHLSGWDRSSGALPPPLPEGDGYSTIGGLCIALAGGIPFAISELTRRAAHEQAEGSGVPNLFDSRATHHK